LWFFGGAEVWRLCFCVGGVGSGSFGGAEVRRLFFVSEGLVLVLSEGLRFRGYFLCRVFLYLGEFSVVGGGTVVIIFIQSVFKYRCSAGFLLGVLSGSCYFLSKCLRLAVIFNFKSNKFNYWHQNITGKSRGPGSGYIRLNH
jgi:hypothetical protein